MTGDPDRSKVVNLNKARKARDRAEEKAQADANALRHGRTKAQRLLEATQADKARRTLDQSKFEE
jgi:phage protein D